LVMDLIGLKSKFQATFHFRGAQFTTVPSTPLSEQAKISLIFHLKN